MKDLVIGVLGGMGTYATVHFFQQYADVFEAKKEFDRPRIIIDNRCTMPSRVRAFLYNEKVDELVNEMTDSMQNLVDSGCTHIVLACNTSHLFLPEIYKKVPSLENKVINIIKQCVSTIQNDGVKEVYLLGSEGTIDSSIYQNALEKYGIKCIVPKKDEYRLIRKCIEAVKQNMYNEDTKNIFVELVNRYDTCILGCTELPILYDKYKSDIAKSKKIYDPLLLVLKRLKEEYDYE